MADKNQTVPELATELQQKNTRINEILDAAGDEEFSDAQLDEITELETDIGECEKRLKDAQERGDNAKGIRDRANARKAAQSTPTNRPGQAARTPDNAVKTLGEKFVGELKEYFANLKSADGNISKDRKVESPSVAVAGLLKTLVTGASATSAGAFVTPDREVQIVDRSPFRTLTLRDIITTGTTDSDTIEFAIINGYTNNADVVPEAIATFGTSGIAPESGFVGKVETAIVRDISHFVAMTKRAMADAGQIKMFVDTFLTFGLGDKLERGMLTGDGQGENFEGIFNNSGIQAQPFFEDILKTVRKARTKAVSVGQVTPNAVLMHPETWEQFDLSTDGEQRFHFGGPSILGNPRLWGVPVIENNAVPFGTALLGDYRYAALWDREAAELNASDSPENFFLRKLVAVMASMRAAFGVLYPKAFVEIDLTAGA